MGSGGDRKFLKIFLFTIDLYDKIYKEVVVQNLQKSVLSIWMENNLHSQNMEILKMSIEDEYLYEEYEHRNDVESARKKFEGQKYLDPRCDPAFRALLDSEDALVNFLNAILHFEGENAIQSLTYTVQQDELFHLPEPYRVTFDIGARTKAGKRIDVEMQKLKLNGYVDRMMIYNAFLLLRAKNDYNKEIGFRELPEAQKKKFRYRLPEIYSIWIMDYPVQFMENVYRDEVGLYNQSCVGKDGCVPISTKNKYIIVDLTKFNKPKDKLETDEDRWLYILKNAGSSRSLPEFDNPTFDDALRRIECDSASDELLIKQANMKDFLYAYSDAIDESFEKGRDNERTAIALDMLVDNEPIEKIVKYSHLSKEKILELQKSVQQKS